LFFFRGSDLLHGMTPRLLLVWVVVLAFTGCGKRPETASPAPTLAKDSSQTAAGTPAAEQTPAPAPRSDAPGADLAATLSNLTQALRKYSFEHQRLPKTFSEVVAAGYVKDMPQAPAGKKFEIDAKTVRVILVKQ
jgi:nitrous oxide reductase accessory protein NosL